MMKILREDINKDPIDQIEEFLKLYSFQELIESDDELEFDIYPYEVTIYTYMSHFGSAWTSRPVVGIQIDDPVNHPNGFLGIQDIETQREYDSEVNQLISKLRSKVNEDSSRRV